MLVTQFSGGLKVQALPFQALWKFYFLGWCAPIVPKCSGLGLSLEGLVSSCCQAYEVGSALHREGQKERPTEERPTD